MRPGEYDPYNPFPPPEPPAGKDGKSAYEIAVEHGYVGSESDWIAYVQANGDEAQAAQDAAVCARDEAEASAGSAAASAAAAAINAEQAGRYSAEARASAASAGVSEDNASHSAQAASGHRNAAVLAATAAEEQAVVATGRADEAVEAQIRAAESERLCSEMYLEIMRAPRTAEEYARQAGASADEASASAVSASGSAEAAAGSAEAAGDSAGEAAASAESAAASLTDITTGLASKLGRTETAVNAERVNGLTVETAVPANAVFTDTTYDALSASEAETGTATTGRVITAKVLADYVAGVVATAVANLVNSSPATLDTLKELSDAIGSDPNFATTMATALAGKLGVNDTAVNAAKVNNLTVETAVPANAVFTDTTYSNFVGSGSAAAAGLVPSPGSTAGSTKFLREDGSWQVPPDNNTTYSNATTSAAGLMSATDKTILDGVPTTYATLSDMNTLATTATNSVAAAQQAASDAVSAKNTAQQIADGLSSLATIGVDTSLTINGQAANAKTVGDKFDVIGASSATNNEYLCVWLDSANRVLFGVKADGSFYWQKGIPKVLKDELDGIKARLTALEA